MLVVLIQMDPMSLISFLDALQAYRGKQVNFDFRISDKDYHGRTYRGAFLIVKEMIPRDQDPAVSNPAARNQM